MMEIGIGGLAGVFLFGLLVGWIGGYHSGKNVILEETFSKITGVIDSVTRAVNKAIADAEEVEIRKKEAAKAMADFIIKEAKDGGN